MKTDVSGRAIALMQEQDRRQTIIDCSLAMIPAWEAAIEALVKNLAQHSPDIGREIGEPLPDQVKRT